MSHEIRTPMNGVLGMLGLLLDTTVLTPVQQDYVETALSSGKALLSLVNDVLDLSKIEAGCMEVERIPFCIADEMDGILGMFGERSRGKGIELAALVPESLSLPFLVMGDPTRFRQVIINLVGNALKFCTKGHILIRVVDIPEDEDTEANVKHFHSGQYFSQVLFKGKTPAERTMWQTLCGRPVADGDSCWESIQLSNQQSRNATASPQQPRRLLVWVEDSGIGIPDSAKEPIFTPFTQADSSTSRKYGGTGIGLNISKQLVQLMSGKITLTSQVAAGTTFRLDIRVDCPTVKPQSRKASTSVENALPHFTSAPPFDHSQSPKATISTSSSLATPAEAPNLRGGLHGLHALCFDNCGVRAEITMQYLRRVGLHSELIRVEGDCLWTSPQKKRANDAAPDPTPDLTPRACPDLLSIAHVAFVEASPMGGVWGVGPDEDLPKSGVPAAQGHLWIREYLRRLGVRVREMDSRLGNGVQRVVPLVLLANEQDPKLEAAAKVAGFAGVVVKPLRCTSVLACLCEVLGISGSKLSKLTLAGIPSNGEDTGMDLDILKGRNFMVVDDNAVNRKVASKVLEKYGVVVTCMSGGEDAVRAVTGTHEFDIILTDIQMPGMSGYDTTRMIREMEKNGLSRGPFLQRQQTGTPILAMTADVMKGSWERCKESGMDGFITKPLEEQRLLQVLQKFLRDPGYEDDE